MEQGFLRSEALADGEEGELAPQADVYLDMAVPEPAAGTAAYWLALEQSLVRRRDAGALMSLGIAFVEHPLGDRRANQQHAEVCYRAVLEVYTRQAVPADRALTQNNLGNALSDQAGLAEGAARADLLGQAVTAYRATLEVHTRQAAPADWAMTQFNLALLHQYRAIALSEEEQDAALQALSDAYVCITSSLEVYTREAMPADHLDAVRLGEAIEAAMRVLGGEPGK